MEHLYRLVNKDKVVGCMKLEGGKIYHKKNHTLTEFNVWKDISEILHIGDLVELKNYIPHDRIDQYTGIEIDGVKVFERDEVSMPISGYHWDDAPKPDDFMHGVIGFKNGTFVLIGDDGYAKRMWKDGQNDWSSIENNVGEFEEFGKITGIHGVK